jgi:hypothetical protein
MGRGALGALAAVEPSSAGCWTATSGRAMNSGRQPRTPFSIADILGPRMVPREPSAPQFPESRPDPDPTSPLWALEELTSKTFLGLDARRAPQLSEGIAQARSRTLTPRSPHFSLLGSVSQT